MEAEDEAVCGPCYHRHHAAKCARCGLSLHTLAGAGEEAGPGVKIITCNQETFHLDCYTCKVTPLTSEDGIPSGYLTVVPPCRSAGPVWPSSTSA